MFREAGAMFREADLFSLATEAGLADYKVVRTLNGGYINTTGDRTGFHGPGAISIKQDVSYKIIYKFTRYFFFSASEFVSID